jgi:uncharacterized membrane protein
MNKSASSFALTAAALLAAGCGGPSAAEDASMKAAGQIKCMGVHACKGQSQCAVPDAHFCAGYNDCKGKGWIKATPPECEQKGGYVLKES